MQQRTQKETKKKERRGDSRFPYLRPFSYVAMWDPSRPPSHATARGEILDLSNGGMKIRIKRQTHLTEGVVVIARIPLRNIKAAVPTLAIVKWTKALDAGLQAGLRFIME